VQEDIRAGLAECVRWGTTLLGDIAAEGVSWATLEGAPLRAVVFRELLGLTAERAEHASTGAHAWLGQLPERAQCRPGLSPHAPYSARYSLQLEACAATLPITIHLAESAEEVELLAHRTGPFVPFLQELGVWDPDALLPSVEDHLRQGVRGAPTLFAHGNYLDPTAPLSSHSTIVYCPRTHAAFGHPPHPFRDFLTRGVRVALGTDSLASNPDLDLLAEARFVHARHPELPGDIVLRMATLAGAEALGWQDETGSLEPGKSADLIVLPLPDADEIDPHRLVLASTLPVTAVLWRGQWAHSSPVAKDE
jgi:cytosine/adenosine deaminase-related metal-dependent hydrolase